MIVVSEASGIVSFAGFNICEIKIEHFVLFVGISQQEFLN